MSQRKIILLANSLSGIGGVPTRCKSMHRYLNKFYKCEIIELKTTLGCNKKKGSNFITLLRMLFAFRNRMKEEPPNTVVISFSDLPNLVNSLSSCYSIASITGFPSKRNGLGVFRYFIWKYCLNIITLFLCKRIVPCSPVVVPNFIANIPTIKKKLCTINGFLDTSNLKLNCKLGDSLKSQFPDGYFLYIGLLDKNKSVNRIIESYKIYCSLTKNRKNAIPLLIVGSGPEEKYCKKNTEYFNRNLLHSDWKEPIPRVIYHKETEYAFTYIKNASVVLLASRLEGFSNVALESIYAKTPILLSRNEGNIFLYNLINSGQESDLIKLLPLPSRNRDLSAWASSMYYYAHIFTGSFDDPRSCAVSECSAEVNIMKWRDVIDSI